MTFLDEILAHKRLEIAGLDEAELRRMALDAPAPRPFLPSWPRSNGNDAGARRVRLIAELKRASPSRGLLAPHLDLGELARIYAAHGAAAISVLTDARFFLGSLDTLRGLRSADVPSPPLLRKDFILSPAQLYETRAAGADAVLLIAAALEDGDLAGDAAVSRLPAGVASLRDLHALALEQGLTPLVEVHSLPELEHVLRLPGLQWVGINNRDLHTFNVTLETTTALRPHVPPGVGVVSESGIFTAADVTRLAAIGVDAVLVGQALVTAADIGAKVRELSGVVCTA
jgi:indole-3-glycerol phosphate synthase